VLLKKKKVRITAKKKRLKTK